MAKLLVQRRSGRQKAADAKHHCDEACSLKTEREELSGKGQAVSALEDVGRLAERACLLEVLAGETQGVVSDGCLLESVYS